LHRGHSRFETGKRKEPVVQIQVDRVLVIKKRW